jgi:hypothetical protein
MFDRGESSPECFLSQTFKASVSSIKQSGLLAPLENIQGCCLLYQTFKAAVSSQICKAAVSSINHSAAWNV